MANVGMARRYAQALYELAVNEGRVSQVELDLMAVVNAIKTIPEVKELVESSLMTPKAKEELLRKAFAGQVHPDFLDFLGVVVRRRREGLLPVILEQYQSLVNEGQGLIEVEVASAVELDEATLENLRVCFSNRAGGQGVKLKTRVQPDLIGGVVVTMGDTVYDGSVKTRLNRLRERLLHSEA